MRDAYGGIINIVIVVVFLVIVSSYLAFNVNYTKAFRLKNKIISVLEEYEGKGYESESAVARKKIKEYAQQIGYSNNNIKVDGEGWKCDSVGYCIKKHENSSKEGVEKRDTCYFEVVTQINISLPIINNIMGLRIFQVTGSTKTIEGC